MMGWERSRRAAAVMASLGLGGCLVVNGAFEPVGDGESVGGSSSSTTVVTGDPAQTSTGGTSEASDGSGGASESTSGGVDATSTSSSSETTSSGSTTGESSSEATTTSSSSTGPDACAGDPADLCAPQQIGGQTYLTCEQLRTWEEARLVCEAHCARLVILDEAESAAIFAALRLQMTAEDIAQEASGADPVTMPRASWWIGGRWVDGTYLWLDGTPMPANGTGGWAPNNPDAPGADSFAVLGVFAKADANGKWFDRSGVTTPYRPICEPL